MIPLPDIHAFAESPPKKSCDLLLTSRMYKDDKARAHDYGMLCKTLT